MAIDLTETHDGEYKDIVINGTRLMIFPTGRIFRMSKCGYWKHIQNTANSTDGYNYIGVGRPDDGNKKMITRHRIMGYAFLNLDIENPKILMDHIDCIRTNNNINNLRLVNYQQNQFNRTTAKGYTYNKVAQKFQATIGINSKLIYLGLYDTKEEARLAYLQAKIIYHTIVNDTL